MAKRELLLSRGSLSLSSFTPCSITVDAFWSFVAACPGLPALSTPTSPDSFEVEAALSFLMLSMLVLFVGWKELAESAWKAEAGTLRAF